MRTRLCLAASARQALHGSGVYSGWLMAQCSHPSPRSETIILIRLCDIGDSKAVKVGFRLGSFSSGSAESTLGTSSIVRVQRTKAKRHLQTVTTSMETSNGDLTSDARGTWTVVQIHRTFRPDRRLPEAEVAFPSRLRPRFGGISYILNKTLAQVDLCGVTKKWWEEPSPSSSPPQRDLGRDVILVTNRKPSFAKCELVCTYACEMTTAETEHRRLVSRRLPPSQLD